MSNETTQVIYSMNRVGRIAQSAAQQTDPARPAASLCSCYNATFGQSDDAPLREAPL